MKRLWRRILILSAMLMLVLSVHALADQTQYSAKWLTFPNNNSNAGWSNQFTVYSNTNIAVGINMVPTTNYFSEYYVNMNLRFVLQNVYTRATYTLTGQQIYSRNYELSATVPAGTYSFGVYYNYANYSCPFKLYFRVVGNPGINAPEKLEVQVGTTETVEISQQNSRGKTYYVKIDSCKTTDKTVTRVTEINNSVMPPTITISGVSLGTAYIYVYGADGSEDTIEVHVVAEKKAPTLLDYSLDMGVGDIVTNEVIGAENKVTWSSSNTKVAKVTGVDEDGDGIYEIGQIKALASGSAVIHAKTKKYGIEYDLACKLSVEGADPNFVITLKKIVPAKKRLKISITNNSGSPMTVVSSGAILTNYPAYEQIRTLKMKGAKKVTIPNGKTKKITFNIRGRKLDMSTTSLMDYGVRVKFKLDGRVYFARCNTYRHLGEYILRKDLYTGEWKYSNLLEEGA